VPATNLADNILKSFQQKRIFRELLLLGEILTGSEIAGLLNMPGYVGMAEQDVKLILVAVSVQNAFE